MGLLSKITQSAAVNVQARTPVTAVTSETDVPGTSSTPSTHTIHTARGSIRASKVIYTTNAYTSALLPEYAANIVPCRGICTHITTPPAPDGKNRAPFLPYSYILGTQDGKGSSYLISRPDGSIIVGGAMYTFKSQLEKWYDVVDDSTLIEPTKDYYHGYMQRTFRGWEDSGAYVKEVWSGSRCLSSNRFDFYQADICAVMGYSYDSAPHVGAIPGKPGQYICAAFNGHGMPVVFLSAKGVAEMVHSGKRFEEVGLPRIFKSTTERIDRARNGPEGGDILD